MHLLHYVKNYRSTFVFRLMIFFTIIILVFSAFQLVAYNYFRKNMDNEIIKYNRNSLTNTSARFSEILSRCESTLLQIHFKDEFLLLSSNNATAYDINRICIDILSAALNSNPYIKDIFLFSGSSPLVLTAYGTHMKNNFFKTVYSNDQYSEEFWHGLLQENFSFNYLQSKPFLRKEFGTSQSNLLFPVVFKPGRKQDYLFVALLDMKKILKDIEPDAGKDFYISIGSHWIYDKLPLNGQEKEELQWTNNYAKHYNSYYFRHSDNAKQLFCYKSISYKSLQQSMNKVNTLFICIIAVSVIISFVISLSFSIRVNNPIKRIVEIIKSGSPLADTKVHIHELEFISKGVHKLITENMEATRDLSNKNSILKKYFYQVSLKNIYNEVIEFKDYFKDKKTSFLLLHFTLHYLQDAFAVVDQSFNKATFFLSEYIQRLIESQALESVTIQTEENQIISIVNMDNTSNDIHNLAEYISVKLENEKDFLFVTIAIGSAYEDIASLNMAYSEVYSISQHQRLDRNNQILTCKDLTENNKFYFSSEQERLLSGHLSNGSSEECIKLVNQVLDINYHREVRLLYFQKLALQLINTCLMAVNTVNPNLLKDIDINDRYRKINMLYSLYEYKTLFTDLIHEITSSSEAKRRNDYIKSFVLDYIEKHICEDIYLDLLSEKLNISSGYLSQYFKDKIGVNFSDYLNIARLNKAKQMLQSTNEKVDVIAKKAGYNNANSFIRSFKKYFKVTPGEFRKALIRE